MSRKKGSPFSATKITNKHSQLNSVEVFPRAYNVENGLVREGKVWALIGVVSGKVTNRILVLSASYGTATCNGMAEILFGFTNDGTACKGTFGVQSGHQMPLTIHGLGQPGFCQLEGGLGLVAGGLFVGGILIKAFERQSKATRTEAMTKRPDAPGGCPRVKGPPSR